MSKDFINKMLDYLANGVIILGAVIFLITLGRVLVQYKSERVVTSKKVKNFEKCKPYFLQDKVDGKRITMLPPQGTTRLSIGTRTYSVLTTNEYLHFITLARDAVRFWNKVTGKKVFTLVFRKDSFTLPPFAEPDDGINTLDVAFFRWKQLGMATPQVNVEDNSALGKLGYRQIEEVDVGINIELVKRGQWNTLQTTLIHELGHALGLAHTAPRHDIMARFEHTNDLKSMSLVSKRCLLQGLELIN